MSIIYMYYLYRLQLQLTGLIQDFQMGGGGGGKRLCHEREVPYGRKRAKEALIV